MKRGYVCGMGSPLGSRTLLGHKKLQKEEEKEKGRGRNSEGGKKKGGHAGARMTLCSNLQCVNKTPRSRREQQQIREKKQ